MNPRAPAYALDHVGLAVGDLVASRSFYEQALPPLGLHPGDDVGDVTEVPLGVNAARDRQPAMPPATSRLRPPRPTRSGQPVRAWRYGETTSEPSFECESGKTHSLEGGPDRTLSRSQRV